MKYFKKSESEEQRYICTIEDIDGDLCFELDGTFWTENEERNEVLEVIVSDYKLKKINFLLYDWYEWIKFKDTSLRLRTIMFDSLEISDLFAYPVNLLFIKSLIVLISYFDYFDPIYEIRKKELVLKYFELVTCEKCKDYFQDIDIQSLYREQLFAAEHYLELCMNDDNQDWFDLHPENLNREQEVEKIANFLIDLKQNGKYDGYEKLDLLIQKARTWIMLRYDMDKAAYYQFFNHPFWLEVFRFLPEVCGFLILFSLATINCSFWLSIKPPDLKTLNHFTINNFALLALYGILIAEGIMLVKKIKSGKVQTQVFMPRVVGGIIVGYFAMLGEEMWFGLYQETLRFTLGNDFNWVILLARIIIPLAAIYIYLLIEMSNVKGIEDIKIKALRILGRGYAYALMIGVIFSDIFGKNFIDIVSPRFISQKELCFSAVHFKGVFGNIYPEPILLLSPLALFIGVFIQLLWEDKAVTAKI